MSDVIDWNKAEILLIHNCKYGKFTGNKLKTRTQLPSKCLSNICGFYATWYGTCTKTGDACTMCGIKGKSIGKKPGGIVPGQSYKYVNGKCVAVERIVISESVLGVECLEVSEYGEKIIHISKPTYYAHKNKSKRGKLNEHDRLYKLARENQNT